MGDPGEKSTGEVFPLKIGTVIKIDGDVRYLAVRVLVGEEGLGWAICRSGKLVGGERVLLGDFCLVGVVEGAGLVVSGNLDRVVVVERKKERKKERAVLETRG